MVEFIRSRLRSFGYALRGWEYVLRTQRNTWIHAVINIVVFVLGFWLRINLHEWALLILAMGLVWMAEFMNTALEAVVDLATDEDHPLAKVGKDVGAAAVLIAALAAILIGLLVLGPKILDILNLDI